MKPKYSQITNLQELEAAQRQLRRKIERKGKELSGRFENLQQDYSPANLLGMTARTTGSDPAGHPLSQEENRQPVKAQTKKAARKKPDGFFALSSTVYWTFL